MDRRRPLRRSVGSHRLVTAVAVMILVCLVLAASFVLLPRG